MGVVCNLLLAPSVEIDAIDLAFYLVEADIVESLKAGPLYTPDSMIRDKEPFLPAHEDVGLSPPAGIGRAVASLFCAVEDGRCGRRGGRWSWSQTCGRRRIFEIDVSFGIFAERPPRGKPSPMLQIGAVGCAPAGILRLKSVFVSWATNYLTGEEGRQRRVIFCQSADAQVACHGGLRHRECKDLNVNIVDLTVRLLSTAKFGARAEERGGVVRVEAPVGEVETGSSRKMKRCVSIGPMVHGRAGF